MNIGPVRGHVCRSCFWFRVFGYGLSVRRASMSPVLFSEGVGKRKVFRGLGLAVELLRP